MGIINSNKCIDQKCIGCGDIAKVKIAIAAAPDISEHPVDLILLLDNSASMAGAAFSALKKSAKQIIDILDGATGSVDGIIEGSRVGIISFESKATVESQMETNAVRLKQIINNLEADKNGRTNHYDAFNKAISLFNTASANEKIIVMLTDGMTSKGATNADNIARYARETLGIKIYMIGIESKDGIDTDNLKEWASDPDSSHLTVAPTAESIEQMLGNLGENVKHSGATNIEIIETLNDEFEIYEIITPKIGQVKQLSEKSLEWKIEKLGKKCDEGATLEFYIQHVGITSGIKEVNKSIEYCDDEGNKVYFPNPRVKVDCGEMVEYSEPCPETLDVTTENCQDMITFDMSNVRIGGKGRIAEVNLTLRNVCPNRRVAVAVFLSELDSCGNEHPRGRKIFTLPAFMGNECKNVQIDCIKFVLPEDLDLGGMPDTICSKRKFRARAFANIIDYDFFPCCEDKA